MCAVLNKLNWIEITCKAYLCDQLHLLTSDWTAFKIWGFTDCLVNGGHSTYVWTHTTLLLHMSKPTHVCTCKNTFRCFVKQCKYLPFVFQVTHGQRLWLMWHSGVLLVQSQPQSSYSTVKTLSMLPSWFTKRRWTESVCVFMWGAAASSRHIYLIFTISFCRSGLLNELLSPYCPLDLLIQFFVYLQQASSSTVIPHTLILVYIELPMFTILYL